MPGIVVGARAAKTISSNCSCGAHSLGRDANMEIITIWLNTSCASSTYNAGGRLGGRREPWKSKPGPESPRNA